MVRLVDNKMGVSQYRLGCQFGVNQSTINRNLKKRTSVRVYKRRSAPKYISEGQQKRAKSNCLKLYKKISPNCQLILDDEKYFTFSGNVPGDNRYYTFDTSSAPENIKFIQKQKFESHLLVWLAISPRGISNPYIRRSKIAIREEIYLKQCIRGRLLPFIKRMIFCFGLIWHHRIMRIQCYAAWSQIIFLMFVETKTLLMYLNVDQSKRFGL